MSNDERIKQRISEHILAAPWREREQLRRASLRLVMDFIDSLRPALQSLISGGNRKVTVKWLPKQ